MALEAGIYHVYDRVNFRYTPEKAVKTDTELAGTWLIDLDYSLAIIRFSLVGLTLFFAIHPYRRCPAADFQKSYWNSAGLP